VILCDRIEKSCENKLFSLRLRRARLLSDTENRDKRRYRENKIEGTERKEMRSRVLRDTYLLLSRMDHVPAGPASTLAAKGWCAARASVPSARARLDWPVVFPCVPPLSCDR